MPALQEDEPRPEIVGGEVTQVTLGDLVTDEALFQRRMAGWADTWEGKDQINNLVRHLKNTREPLDPILVLPREGRFVVIDGHHRRRAYEVVKWAGPIPVKVFRGTLPEAREAAFLANSKGQRPLTLHERQEVAWDYTKQWFFDGQQEMSKAWTAKHAGVAEGTVARMRKILRAQPEAVKDLSWLEVTEAASGREGAGGDPGWAEKAAQELKDALLRLNIIHYAKSPDILARALESISPTLPRALVEHWTEVAIQVAELNETGLEAYEVDAEAGRIPRI